jgi:hypothetical protein
MGKTIDYTGVTAFKDNVGVYPEGKQFALRCDFMFVGNHSIGLTTGGDGCGLFEPGDTFDNGYPDTMDAPVATVEIYSQEWGALWISPTDYAAALASCDACCVTV